MIRTMLKFQDGELSQFYGKVGIVNCSGFEFISGDFNIRVTPLLKDGYVSGSSFFQIPKNELMNFIKELQNLI